MTIELTRIRPGPDGWEPWGDPAAVEVTPLNGRTLTAPFAEFLGWPEWVREVGALVRANGANWTVEGVEVRGGEWAVVQFRALPAAPARGEGEP